MKKLSALILLSACSTQDNSSHMRLMTYNIKHGELSSLEQIARLINAEFPTVVALQEVDEQTERTSYIRQVDRLAELTGMQPLYFQTDHEYKVGIGFLVSPSIIVNDKWSVNVTVVEDGNPRIISVIETDIFGHDYVFINTHLSYIQSDRQLEMVQLSNFVEVFSDHKTVLMGDFNTSSRQSIPMEECGPIATYPASNPTIAIDGILLSNIECITARSIMVDYSDHLPLVVDVE